MRLSAVCNGTFILELVLLPPLQGGIVGAVALHLRVDSSMLLCFASGRELDTITEHSFIYQAADQSADRCQAIAKSIHQPA